MLSAVSPRVAAHPNCPICLEGPEDWDRKEVVILHNGANHTNKEIEEIEPSPHWACHQCAMQLINRNLLCPICRRKARTLDSRKYDLGEDRKLTNERSVKGDVALSKIVIEYLTEYPVLYSIVHGVLSSRCYLALCIGANAFITNPLNSGSYALARSTSISSVYDVFTSIVTFISCTVLVHGLLNELCKGFYNIPELSTHDGAPIIQGIAFLASNYVSIKVIHFLGNCLYCAYPHLYMASLISIIVCSNFIMGVGILVLTFGERLSAPNICMLAIVWAGVFS